MSITHQTATFSQLLRSPNEVVAATEHGTVLLTRRDDGDLVLASAETERRNRAGLAFAANVISVAVADWPGSFAHRLHQPFPWMTFLNEDEQELFASELVDVCRACAALGRFEALSTLVGRWEATADAYAAGVTAEGSELDWLDTPTVVTRPE